MPFVICDACHTTGVAILHRLRGYRWCGSEDCAEEIHSWFLDDFDADELGVDPEEEFDA